MTTHTYEVPVVVSWSNPKSANLIRLVDVLAVLKAVLIELVFLASLLETRYVASCILTVVGFSIPFASKYDTSGVVVLLLVANRSSNCIRLEDNAVVKLVSTVPLVVIAAVNAVTLPVSLR